MIFSTTADLLVGDRFTWALKRVLTMSVVLSRGVGKHIADSDDE